MRRASSALLLAAAILAAAAAAGLLVGSVHLSLGALWRGDATARAIFGLRWPRVAVGAAVGMCLAAAGAAFQALLKNPLGDPFLLGTSGGAAAGAAVGALLGAMPLASPLFALAGAGVASLAVMGLARREGTLDLNRLLLAGVTLNAFFSAVILLSFSAAPFPAERAILFWMMGSLAGASAGTLAALAAYGAAGFAVLMACAGDLNLFLAGEEEAASLGVETERTKVLVFLAASLLTAAATAFVGIVGFVGLIAPHAARLLWGNDQRVLLPASALLGGAMVVAGDAVARAAFAPAEIAIGAVTALAGVPAFLWLLRRFA